MQGNLLLRLLGYRGSLLNADPTVWDRYRWLRRHLKPGGRTLDAGCGSGAFTFFAAHAGAEAVGISDFAPGLEAAKKRASMLGLSGRTSFLPYDLAALDTYSADLGTFDNVICLETIEHLPDDQKLVVDLSAVLRPGGRLFLTTPSHDHRPFFGEEMNTGGHQRWGYKQEELRQIVEAAGLRLVDEGSISGVISQKLASLTFRLSRLNPYLAWAVVFPLRVLQLFDRAATRILRYPDLSITMVAEKR